MSAIYLHFETLRINQHTLSFLFLVNVLFLCKSYSQIVISPVFSISNVINPVISSVQPSSNNRPTHQLERFSHDKDINLVFVETSHSSILNVSEELVCINLSYFNQSRCSLSGLPLRHSFWYALIVLRNECSSVDVILSTLQSASLLNVTLLRGILFYITDLRDTPINNDIFHSTDELKVPLHAFSLSRESASSLLRQCCDYSSSNHCTTTVTQISSEASNFSLSVQFAPTSPQTKKLLPPSPPAFSRHRTYSSESHGNQSVVSSTLSTATRSETTGDNGGTINAEDAFLNRSSVLFVAVSFILLMFISLAWLVFYYVQRFRYLHSKERASRRLAELARRAVARIPLKQLQAGDKEIGVNGEHCVICIEPYRPFDSIRTLPCRHYFHKVCIDPWLLEQRSCPMCKLDILQAYDFRPETASCPTSTVGGDDSSSPSPPLGLPTTVSHAIAIAPGARNTVAPTPGSYVRDPANDDVVLTAYNKSNAPVLSDAINTTQASSSGEMALNVSNVDLRNQLIEVTCSPSTVPESSNWLRGLFRISETTSQRHRNKRLRQPNNTEREYHEAIHPAPSGNPLLDRRLSDVMH